MSSPRLPLGRKKYPRILPAPEPGERGRPDEEGGPGEVGGALPPKRQRRAGRFACDACRSKKSAVWLFYFVSLAHHWRNSLRPSRSGPPEVAAPWHAIVPAHLNGDTCLHTYIYRSPSPTPSGPCPGKTRRAWRGNRCRGVTLQSVRQTESRARPSPSCRGRPSAHPPTHPCLHHPSTHSLIHSSPLSCRVFLPCTKTLPPTP